MSDNFDSNAVMKDDGLTEAPEAPKKAPTTPPSTQGADDHEVKAPKGSTNTYVVERGDNPWDVAHKLYGQGSLGNEIVRKNPTSEWKPGDILELL